MTTPVGKPPLHPPTDQSVAPDKPIETSKQRISRMRTNSMTLTPEQIKALMLVKEKEKK